MYKKIPLKVWGLIAVVVGTVVTYFQSLWYPFIFDDVPTITHNYLVKLGSLSQIFNAHTRWVSVMINNLTARFAGFDPFYFRLVSLAMHLTLGLVVFGLLRTLLSGLKNKSWAQQNADWLSVIAAGLFLLHPVQTQTATYISQMRLEGLALLTTLLTIWSMVNMARARSEMVQWAWYATAIGLAFISAGTKEIIIVLPMLALLTEWFFVAQGDRSIFFKRLLWYLPLVAVFYLTFTHFPTPFSVSQVLKLDIALDNNRGNILTGALDKKITSLHYLSGQFRVLFHYFTMFVWPFGLSFDYGWALPTSWLSLDVLGYLALLCLMAAYVIRRWWKDPLDVVAWGAVWFFIAIIPRASIVPSAELACDYKTYLGSPGMMLVLAYGLLSATQWLASWLAFDRAKIATSVMVVCALFCSIVSNRRNVTWSSELNFWTDVIEKQEHKSSRVYNNYAAALYGSGQKERGIAMLHESCKADPLYAEPIINLGTCALFAGNKDEAIAYYEKAVSYTHEPHAEAFASLASLYAERNLIEKAVSTIIPALQLNPFYPAAWDLLISLYQQLGHPSGAQHALQQKMNTTDKFDLDRHVAAAYFFQNNIPEALTLLEKVVLQDDCFLYNFMAATCYYQQARYEKAAHYFARAHQFNPTHTSCAYNLGMSYLNTQKYAEAQPVFGSMLHLQETFPYVRLQYAKCLAAQGIKDAAQKTLKEILSVEKRPDIRAEAASLLATT